MIENYIIFEYLSWNTCNEPSTGMKWSVRLPLIFLIWRDYLYHPSLSSCCHLGICDGGIKEQLVLIQNLLEELFLKIQEKKKKSFIGGSQIGRLNYSQSDRKDTWSQANPLGWRCPAEDHSFAWTHSSTICSPHQKKIIVRFRRMAFYPSMFMGIWFPYPTSQICLPCQEWWWSCHT